MYQITEKIKKKLYDYPVKKDYRQELPQMEEGKTKMPIVSHTMFEAVFQNEERLKYSCEIISHFVDYSYEELLKNLHFTKNEFDKNRAIDKGLRGDYVAEINHDKIGIELNNNTSEFIKDRNVAYGFHLYSAEDVIGNKGPYNRVIQINLNNFYFERENKQTVEYYFIQNDQGEVLTDKVVFIQVYLPLIRKKWYDGEELDELERFLLVMMEPNLEVARKLGKGNELMEEYIKDAKVASSEGIWLESYNKEQALQEEYFNEGMEKGLEQGLEQGEEAGRKDEKLKIAREMLADNMDMLTVSKYTGLNLEKLQEITQELEK